MDFIIIKLNKGGHKEGRYRFALLLKKKMLKLKYGLWQIITVMKSEIIRENQAINYCYKIK